MQAAAACCWSFRVWCRGGRKPILTANVPCTTQGAHVDDDEGYVDPYADGDDDADAAYM